MGNLYPLFFVDFRWCALYRMADPTATAADRIVKHHGDCRRGDCEFIFMVRSAYCFHAHQP